MVRVDGWWYIFQKLRNPTTKQWEGGIATRLTPTIFRLNPDLDPFEGDLLRQLVIRPIEDELDLLTEQVHEAPDDEPDIPQTESPQESDASIPDQPRRMSAVTLTPTQSTIATALTSRSGPPPSSSAPGPTGGGGGSCGGGSGGGGGGGGGGPAQPAAVQPAVAPQGNGKLEGKEPTVFNGDRAKADEFMHELKLYQFLNSTAPVMTDPY